MSRTPLFPALFTAVILHLVGLVGVARFWGALDVPRLSPQSRTIAMPTGHDTYATGWAR
jgi:hypothetical protein